MLEWQRSAEPRLSGGKGDGAPPKVAIETRIGSYDSRPSTARYE